MTDKIAIHTCSFCVKLALYFVLALSDRAATNVLCGNESDSLECISTSDALPICTGNAMDQFLLW